MHILVQPNSQANEMEMEDRSQKYQREKKRKLLSKDDGAFELTKRRRFNERALRDGKHLHGPPLESTAVPRLDIEEDETESSPVSCKHAADRGCKISPQWYDKHGNFRPIKGASKRMYKQETCERHRCSRQDLEGRNIKFITNLCEAMRGNLWRCKVDWKSPLMTGCRNYIITLVFGDGTKWLLKTQQPEIPWSTYSLSDTHLKQEIATMIWIHDKTGVPIPRIRAWDVRRSKANKFGKPYYIMHMAAGKTLNTQFSLALDQPASKQWAYREKISRQLANVQMELLKHPFEKWGVLTLHPSSYQWAGLPDDNSDRTVKVMLKGDNPLGDGVTTYSAYLNGKLTLSWKMQKEVHRKLGLSLAAREFESHVFSAAQYALQKVIYEPFNAGPFFLAHQDYTEDNMLCDSEFNLTAIIDWELAQTIPLQHHLDCLIWDYESIDELLGKHKKTAVKEVIRDYELNAKECRKERDVFRSYIEELDNGEKGDATTPFTVEPKFITRLYQRNEIIAVVRTLGKSRNLLALENATVRESFFKQMLKRVSITVDALDVEIENKKSHHSL